MRNKDEVVKFLKAFDIMYIVESRKDFIRDKALKLGATYIIYILTPDRTSLMDFYFNSKDECIGYGDDSISGEYYYE